MASVCSRCGIAVYQAEQVLGPARRIYHKPCLRCMACDKRLDASLLVEHDADPYCKLCYIRSFGPRDLRQANLPNRESPHSSPVRSVKAQWTGPIVTVRSTSPVKQQWTGARSQPTTPILRPTRALSPTKATFLAEQTHAAIDEGDELDEATQEEKFREHSEIVRVVPATEWNEEPAYDSTPTHTLRRGPAGLPRTVPLSPTKSRPGTPVKKETALNRDHTLPVSIQASRTEAVTAKVSLSATRVSSPTQFTPRRTWTAPMTPKCPSCSTPVYFAESIKAVGATWHKACLRCTECSTSLDPGRLSEKDGLPFCYKCYGQLHGPRGGGYALLGKAGG